MPAATLRARTRPYQPELRTNERICTRCGIKYKVNSSRDSSRTECRDCGDVEGNHSRPERTKGVFDPSKCGTTAGYSQHKSYGVPICPPCQEAARAYERERKRAKSKTVCGTVAGWTRHKRAGEEPCDPCTEAQRKYERDYYHTKRRHAA